MARFTVGIFQNGTNPHVQCFAEISKALAEALKELGHELSDFDNPGRLIMFGVNNVTDPANQMPDDAIIFNTEQVAAEFRKDQISALELFKQRKRVIWDYSSSNIDELKRRGAERVVHCPIGYHESMSMIDPPDGVRDIDVLFYGSTNPRRLEILDALDAAGLKVARVFGLYGHERDDFIRRSKVVLNLHFFERPIFEIFRVSHLLANSACVVSEDGSQDEALESFARQVCVVVSREQIVETCKRYVRSDDMRMTQALGGFLRFAKTNFTENVRKALEQSGVR